MTSMRQKARAALNHALVSGRNGVGESPAAIDFLRAVIHFHRQTTGHHVSDMADLAAIGANDRLNAPLTTASPAAFFKRPSVKPGRRTTSTRSYLAIGPRQACHVTWRQTCRRSSRLTWHPPYEAEGRYPTPAALPRTTHPRQPVWRNSGAYSAILPRRKAAGYGFA